MSSVIIFGAGDRGVKCKNQLLHSEQILGLDTDKPMEIYFTDNNEHIWNTSVDGTQVIPPDNLANLDKDSTAVIIASSRENEIYSQIRKYGFKRLFCLDGNDSIVPFDSVPAKLNIFKRNMEKSETYMGYYSFFEAYSYLGKIKYNDNTLYDRPFFGFTRHLAEFKDIHKGERCFILGNGPSLNLIDISKIKDEITFGSNRVYKAFSEWGFHTKYWGMIDELFISQIGDEALQSIPDDVFKFMPFKDLYFLDWRSYKNIIPCNFLSTDASQDLQFSVDPFALYEGGTVTYLLIQIAAIMGCNPIYLLGVDHTFPVQARKDQFCFTPSDDSQHFHPNYSNDNLLMNYGWPDVATSAYALAYQELSRMGREIYNASPGTKLEAIPKMKFEDIAFEQ